MRLFTAIVALITLSGVAPASALTCTEAVARCTASAGGKPQVAASCQSAGISCRNTGTFMGPVSGAQWRKLQRK